MLLVRGNLQALIPLILGVLIAIATRPYARLFPCAASAAVVLHASLTRHRRAPLPGTDSDGSCCSSRLSYPSSGMPHRTRISGTFSSPQDANAADASANLSLERVDYSTRESLILNMPPRIHDVILRPYVWQAQNTSQQLGYWTRSVVPRMPRAIGAGACAQPRGNHGADRTAAYPALLCSWRTL